MYTYILLLGLVNKFDEFYIFNLRNIVLNILYVKVDEFIEIRVREEMYLNRRVN